MPSLKRLKYCGHKILFNPVKQHASNTGLTIDCAGCSKPRLVYSAKKFMESEKKLFKCVMSDMIYTSETMIAEFKNPANPENRCYDILDKCSVRANNACPHRTLDITGIQCLHSAKY